MRWLRSSRGRLWATSILLSLAEVKAMPGYSTAELRRAEIGDELPETVAEIHAKTRNELPATVDELHPEVRDEPPARFSEMNQVIGNELSATVVEIHRQTGEELPVRFSGLHPETSDRLPPTIDSLHPEIRNELPARSDELQTEIGNELTVAFPETHPPEVANELPVTLAPPPTSCWMFQHMVKSGGSTVRVMMSAWAVKNDIKHDRYVDYMWLMGDSYANMMLERNSTYILGEYAESLRSYGGGRDCKWFTMFRHPIPRLVSAFFFCKPGGRGHQTLDPLCGHEAIDMETADIVDFAQHWGNYGLRQFVIPYISQDAITSSPAAVQCNQRISTDVRGLSCTAWHLVKLHLEKTNPKAYHSSHFVTNRRPLEEEAMYPYLEAAQDRLSNEYAAVGILEDFDTSLRLFNAALGMPNLDWVRRFRGRINPAQKGQLSDKKAALEHAWTNLALRRYLALDLLLYDHVVAVHAKQVAEHGL